MGRDISQLPEHIIHHILCYIETEEAAQISMFCKIWYNAWLTCPFLNFPYSCRNSNTSFKFIERTLKRYEEQKIRIESLKLGHVSDLCSSSHVDEWIRIAIQNGVERLDVRLKYSFPDILLEAKSLRELSVEHVVMNTMDLKKLNVDKVMFNHLRKLNLLFVDIDDYVFQGIIAGCPLIENLKVYNNAEFKRIRVTNLNNLKEFTLCGEVTQAVEIEAPNLQYLDCKYEDGSLELYNTEKLKYLALGGFLPSSIFLDNSGHKFPQVEHLTLTHLKGRERINISSHSLKHIVIELTKDLREVIIDAPNMVSLELRYITVFPDLSLTNAASQRVSSKICTSMSCHLDTNLLCELKQFLEKVIQSKISLDLSLCYQTRGFFDVRKIPICPVVVIEDLGWKFSFSASFRLSNFLDALFLTCHPKAITFPRCCIDTALLVYTGLIERQNQEIKEVKFEIYDETNFQWRPSDWNTLLERRPLMQVRLRLEWEAD